MEEPLSEFVAAKGALRILLAEDNLVNRRVAVGAVEKSGHAVTVVYTGREALSKLHEMQFDLVPMDVYMPDADGLETGMDAYVSKPLSIKRLQDVIQQTAA